MKKKYLIVLALTLFIASFLRLWKLDIVPPSLFGDELDVGYHAYSILKTGRDYSGNFMPLNFHSLAEWRTPLFLYSAVPTVALFGISPLGVRLPAAIFGIIGILGIYLLVKEMTKKESLGLISALVLTFSPWHIQYSRAAFEVTELLTFLIFGFYFLLKAFKENKYFWFAIPLILLTPLIYNTAKFFTPLILIAVFIIWRREFFAVKKKNAVIFIIYGFIVSVPVIIATLSGGGTQRFGYLSIFNDPEREMEISQDRALDDVLSLGKNRFVSKMFHNKFLYWTESITDNLFQSFSTEFLFINGDLNLRHSPGEIGQLYKIEILTLILGIFGFLFNFKDGKSKLFWLSWLILGAIPSAITRDGGNHATRLFVILPPLVFFISYGIYFLSTKLNGKLKWVFIVLYTLIFLFSFITYQHNYWNHYPYLSNRWWHDGYGQAIKKVKEIDSDYDRVFLTMANEPVWIFFAGWYEYPPDKWQEGYPFLKTTVDGFGEMSFIDKYYFAEFRGDGGIYSLPKFITNKDLYLASAKEIGADLLNEPERTPDGTILLETIQYVTGEPAFYLFSKK